MRAYADVHVIFKAHVANLKFMLLPSQSHVSYPAWLVDVDCHRPYRGAAMDGDRALRLNDTLHDADKKASFSER